MEDNAIPKAAWRADTSLEPMEHTVTNKGATVNRFNSLFEKKDN